MYAVQCLAPPPPPGDLLFILVIVKGSPEAVARGMLAPLLPLPSGFFPLPALFHFIPVSPDLSCGPVAPWALVSQLVVPVVKGEAVPAPWGVAAEGQWRDRWRHELHHQNNGGNAVLASATLFSVPCHLELGLNPPNSLDWSDTFGVI